MRVFDNDIKFVYYLIMKYYSKGEFLNYLKKHNVPASYPALLEYEKKGVIPKSSKIQLPTHSNSRIYTFDDMKKNLELIKNYLKKEGSIFNAADKT